MAVYFFLRKKVKWYLLSAFCAVFIKETSASVIIAILIIILAQRLRDFFKTKKGNPREIVKELFSYGLPIFLLAGWFIWHKIITGWMFAMPHCYQRLMKGLIFSPFFLLFDQGRVLITFFLLGFFLYSFLDKEKKSVVKRWEIFTLILILFCVILLFSIVDFLPRYLILGLPFLFVLFSYTLVHTFKKKKRVACAYSVNIL